MLRSEITPEGTKVTKVDQILLNGNTVCMMVPGGEGPNSVEVTTCDDDGPPGGVVAFGAVEIPNPNA